MASMNVEAQIRGIIPAEHIFGWQPKKVLEHLDEEIPQEGEPCVLDGHPCILYDHWDMAEDWSGEYVNTDLHPFALTGAPTLSVSEFWTLVRRTHPTP